MVEVGAKLTARKIVNIQPRKMVQVSIENQSCHVFIGLTYLSYDIDHQS